jgi:hypothetical protein
MCVIFVVKKDYVSSEGAFAEESLLDKRDNPPPDRADWLLRAKLAPPADSK